MKELQICHYCEEEMNKVTKDHKFPISKIKKIKEKELMFPDDVDLENNIVKSCLACNMNKGTKSYKDFKALGLTAIRHLKKMFLNNQYKTKRTKRKYRKRRWKK